MQTFELQGIFTFPLSWRIVAPSTADCYALGDTQNQQKPPISPNYIHNTVMLVF